MFEQNGRSETVRDRVVMVKCDLAGEGCMHRLVGGSEEIDTKVNRAAQACSRLVSVTLVDRSVLSVEAKAEIRPLR